MTRFFFLAIIFLGFQSKCFSQDESILINKIKSKLEKVSSYTAEGILKTNIAFIKAPVSKIKVYYKKPDMFRIKKDGGISIFPKGGISINLSNTISIKDYVAVSAGNATVNGIQTKVIKLLPTDDNADIVLSTLYIDEPNLLVRKAVTTTKENGTYEIIMSYGKYSKFGLPDKVIFSFNTKDYKLPKGITMEMDEGEKSSDLKKLNNKKGTLEIVYTSYSVNNVIDESVFR